jgi:hypothetical protein
MALKNMATWHLFWENNKVGIAFISFFKTWQNKPFFKESEATVLP